MANVKLLKNKVAKDDRIYTDLFLSWSHNNKVYFVRVEPRFSKDWKLLLANAEELGDNIN
jgi:hypothetical protein